ncbi:MAG: hypothetical protein INR70_23260 [Parafilimonas terrae]|nr:hypothetical protein [Parafilimonas terrae]
MRSPDADPQLRRWVVWSLIAIPLGIGVAVYCGRRLLESGAAWASGGSDGRWMGLFFGILFVGMGCMALWNWLFARPLTPEEERLRTMMRDWQRERDRFTGGGGS